MATIVAQANGNFSSAATWAGGVVPGAGDTAQTGNYAVTIDASITCTLNPTGSGYFHVPSDGITITGDVINQTSFGGGGLFCTHNSGTVTLTGTATGGAGSYAHGAYNAATGTLTVGTAKGGAGSYAHGAYNDAAGTLNVDLAVGNNWGVGGSGGYAYGVYGSGAAGQTTTVKRIQSGPYGAPAIGGAVLMVADASNSAQFRTAYGGATLTLTDPSASADWPAEADVRAGVEYDLGDKTGTAHIPAAANVALGIPVDATVGTAVLTAAAVAAGVWDAARSGHAGAGTFGSTDEWAGSVDEAAIAAAVLGAADVTPIKAALAPAQGAVTFGQVKILANVANEGALHVVNSHASGHGQHNSGGNTGQYNEGGNVGQYSGGGYAGQENYGGNVGQYNEGDNTGQENIGSTPVVGAASQEIADALKLAPAAGAPAVGSVYDLLGDAALEATAQAILSAAGDPWATELPGAYGAGTAGKLLSDLPSAGAGAIAHTITVDDGTNPLDGAEVWISTDEAGSNVVAGTLSTDALGRVTFMLDAGTYWKHVQLAGYNFTAKAFTVA